MARVYTMLRRRSDFARVTRRGRRRASAHLTVLALEGRGRTRVGIVVSGAVGGAVVRNRLRRRLKALLDRAPLGAPPWLDLVVLTRPGAGELDVAALANELTRCLPAG